MTVVRRKVLEELFSSPEWSEKLEKAKTGEDVQKVLTDFCRAKGYKIKFAKHRLKCALKELHLGAR